MKIIAFNISGDNVSPSAEADVEIIPDSTLVLRGRPVFVPDMAGSWNARLCLALRVGRLGRDISPRFASRYVDAVTLAARIVPAAPAAESRALLSALDSTFVPGEWIEASALETSAPHQVEFGPVSASIATLAADIDNAVAVASRFMTLKTGDILLARILGREIPVEPGLSLQGSIDGRELLLLRAV